jgi:hypothetical protein
MLSLSLSIPALGENVEDSLPFCGIVVPIWDRQIRDFPSAFLGHFKQGITLSEVLMREARRGTRYER